MGSLITIFLMCMLVALGFLAGWIAYYMRLRDKTPLAGRLFVSPQNEVYAEFFDESAFQNDYVLLEVVDTNGGE